MVENTKSFLTKLDEMKLDQRLNRLQEDSLAFVQQHEQQSKDFELAKNEINAKMLQSHNEQTKKLKFTQALIIVLLIVEAATMAALLIRKS